MKPLSKKKQVLTELYRQCTARGQTRFHNDDVKSVCNAIGLSNAYDATKLDRSSLLPPALMDDDTFVVHLGEGWHEFVEGIGVGYHRFENVPEERHIQWPYRPSILNNVNTSESNTLFVGFNHKIIHDFLYDDISAAPRQYGSNRTKIPLHYSLGDHKIKATKVQMEIDLTLEYRSDVTVFEAKNGFRGDFNVFQIFTPVRYYTRLRNTQNLPIKSVQACYLLRYRNRLRLYLYTFDDLDKPASIRLLRNAEYTLVER